MWRLRSLNFLFKTFLDVCLRWKGYLSRMATGKNRPTEKTVFTQFCCLHTHIIHETGPGSSVGRVSASETGGRRFKPWPGHTKVFKNGTSCSSFGTQDLRGRARTGQPSVRIMWLGVVCQLSGVGHDISMRRHYKSERWAPCRNQTPSWYDWQIVENDV